MIEIRVLDTKDVDTFYARAVIERKIAEAETDGWVKSGNIEPTYDEEKRIFGFCQVMIKNMD